MWIEIYQSGKKLIFNTELITKIEMYNKCDTNFLEISFTDSTCKPLYFDTVDEIEAFYEGFILALNGLDFYFNGNEMLSDGYIRPILRAKNQALHMHLMLKEALADRK